eukprot:365668-Chlamydomonas_euryale.AAC.6
MDDGFAGGGVGGGDSQGVRGGNGGSMLAGSLHGSLLGAFCNSSIPGYSQQLELMLNISSQPQLSPPLTQLDAGCGGLSLLGSQQEPSTTGFGAQHAHTAAMGTASALKAAVIAPSTLAAAEQLTIVPLDSCLPGAAPTPPLHASTAGPGGDAAIAAAAATMLRSMGGRGSSGGEPRALSPPHVPHDDGGGIGGPGCEAGADTCLKQHPSLQKMEHRNSRATRRGPMDEMRQMVRILVKLMPASSGILSNADEGGGGNRVSEGQIKEYMTRVLGDAPKPTWGMPSGWGAYLSELFTWALGRPVSKEAAMMCARRQPGRSWESVPAELVALGLYPHLWGMPLSQAQVLKANQMGRDHAASMPGALPARAPAPANASNVACGSGGGGGDDGGSGSVSPSGSGRSLSDDDHNAAELLTEIFNGRALNPMCQSSKRLKTGQGTGSGSRGALEDTAGTAPAAEPTVPTAQAAAAAAAHAPAATSATATAAAATAGAAATTAAAAAAPPVPVSVPMLRTTTPSRTSSVPIERRAESSPPHPASIGGGIGGGIGSGGGGGAGGMASPLLLPLPGGFDPSKETVLRCFQMAAACLQSAVGRPADATPKVRLPDGWVACLYVDCCTVTRGPCGRMPST